MSKAVIELQMSMEEYMLLQKALKNYQGKFDRLAGKELGESANKRITKEAEQLTTLMESIVE